MKKTKKTPFIEFDDGSTMSIAGARKLIDAEQWGIGQGSMFYTFYPEPENVAPGREASHHTWVQPQPVRCMVGVLEGITDTGNRERWVVRMNGLDRDDIVTKNDQHDPLNEEVQAVRGKERATFWHDAFNVWEAEEKYYKRGSKATHTSPQDQPYNGQYVGQLERVKDKTYVQSY